LFFASFLHALNQDNSRLVKSNSLCVHVCAFSVTMSLTFFANHVYRERYVGPSEQFIMVRYHRQLL